MCWSYMLEGCTDMEIDGVRESIYGAGQHSITYLVQQSTTYLPLNTMGSTMLWNQLVIYNSSDMIEMRGVL